VIVLDLILAVMFVAAICALLYCTRDRPLSDKCARPDELRWTITKVTCQDGHSYHQIVGPDVRNVKVKADLDH
jgi:hypothetical protein